MATAELPEVPADRGGQRGRPLTSMGRRLPVGQFLPVAQRLAQAVAEWHDGHGPHLALSPGSVLVGEAGQLTLEGSGTAEIGYLAPEQTGRLRHGVDERSDLYVVGLMLYQLATGRPPYWGDTAAEWVGHHLHTVPESPRDLVPDLPVPIAELILQLLAKDPHDRYQSSRGLAADLQHCLDVYRRRGDVPTFLRAGRDVRDHLTIRGSLHGRERFLGRLDSLSQRVAAGNGPTLACVTAVAGMGKSAFIDGYADQVVRAGGRALRGDCAAVPVRAYPGLATALTELAWQLRGEPADAWQSRLTAAVGQVGDAVVALAPALRSLVEPAAAAAPRTPHAARQRLHLAVRRLLGAVCRSERPVLLVLDNAHEITGDGAAILGDLLVDPRLRHLFVVLAYEPRQVPARHPLNALLDRVKAAGSPAAVIALRPLADKGLTDLLADALRCPIADATRLSHVVAARTGSLPIAVAEFLRAGYDRELIVFDESGPGWRWKTEELAELPAVAELTGRLDERVNRVDAETAALLRLAAVAGTQVDLPVLAAATGRTPADVSGALRPALHLEWLEAIARVEPDGRYVQGYRWCSEPARDMFLGQLSRPDRAALHRTALGGYARTAGTQVPADQAVAVVAHLDAAAAGGLAVAPLPGSLGDPLQRARLHRELGAAAWRIGSVGPAGTHLRAAVDLLAGVEDCPPDELHTARLAAARALPEAGDLVGAGCLLDDAAAAADGPVPEAEVLGVRATHAWLAGDRKGQLAATEEALQRLGLGGPAPAADAVPTRLRALREALAATGTTPSNAAAISANATERSAEGTAARLVGSALSLMSATDDGSVQLAVRGAELARGGAVHPDVAIAFACCAVALADRYGEAELGEWYLTTAMELAAADPTGRLTARVLPAAAVVRGPWWTRPGITLDLLSRAQLTSTELGEVGWAESNRLLRLVLRFFAGEPLDSLAEELAATRGSAGQLPGARAAEVGPTGIDPWRLIQACRAWLASMIGRLRGEAGNERPAGAEALPDGSGVTAGLRVADLLTAVVLDDPAATRLARELGHRDGSAGSPLAAESLFYQALAIANQAQTPGRRVAAELDALIGPLDAWARAAPMLFTAKTLLVQAERHRLAGDSTEAATLYHRAISAARDRGAPHLEAIAAERAGAAALAAGETTQAVSYLRSAIEGYRRWNAWARVSEVENLLAGYADDAARQRADELDLIGLIRAFQAIAGEPDLDRVVNAALPLLIRHTGAERGCLLLAQDGTVAPVALAESAPDGVHVASPLAPTAAVDRYAPSTVVEQVRVTGQAVTGTAGMLGEDHLDPYLAKHRPRSLLCAPLSRGDRMVGLVYLEHRERELLGGSGRLETLALLCGQVALAVEHAAAHVRLRAAERAFTAAVERLPSGVALLAPDLTVRHASPVVGELTGLPVAAGSPLVDFFDILAPVGGGQRPYRAALLTAMAGAEPAAPLERRLLVVQPDGATRKLSVSAVPVRDERGQLEAVALLVAAG